MLIWFKLPIFIILFIIILLFTLLLYKLRPRNFKAWILVPMSLYNCFVLGFTLLPIRIYDKEYLLEYHQIFKGNIKYTQLIPMKSILSFIQKDNGNMIQILGNILLFLPIPFFLYVIYIDKEKKFFHFIFIGIITSLCIESLQLLNNLLTKFPSHVFDIDDIILNSVGIILGTIVIFLFYKTPCINKIMDILFKKK